MGAGQARDMVPASGDAASVSQTQSHTPEEAVRQMTVYSEGKTVSAAVAAPRLES